MNDADLHDVPFRTTLPAATGYPQTTQPTSVSSPAGLLEDDRKGGTQTIQLSSTFAL
jgi:hypothetical protein